MIKTESITTNGRQLQRTWSDAGFLIELDGAQYSEAVDPIDSGRTYTETKVPMETEPMTETEEKAMAYDILTGVAE